MIRILIVDDHQMIRDGLKALLMGYDNIEIVGECNDGSEVLPQLKQNEVDIILMDIRMPQMDGIEASKKIFQEFPEQKIIALTMFNEEKYIEEMLKLGTMGYILKDGGKTDLLNAIETVHQGENYYSDKVTETIMAKLTKNKPRAKQQKLEVTLDELTQREKDILRLIAEELTNSEIGEKLNISNRTVDTHRRNLLQKLGVKNTAGLVKYAVKSGLTDQ